METNSGLGKAIIDSFRHWEPLTLFLRPPVTLLDNNFCERALKKAILHRKNSLPYRTRNGAQVGDLDMRLIHTCELNDANPFDYLTGLQTIPLQTRAMREYTTRRGWTITLQVEEIGSGTFQREQREK